MEVEIMPGIVFGYVCLLRSLAEEQSTRRYQLLTREDKRGIGITRILRPGAKFDEEGDVGYIGNSSAQSIWCVRA